MFCSLGRFPVIVLDTLPVGCGYYNLTPYGDEHPPVYAQCDGFTCALESRFILEKLEDCKGFREWVMCPRKHAMRTAGIKKGK